MLLDRPTVLLWARAQSDSICRKAAWLPGLKFFLDCGLALIDWLLGLSILDNNNNNNNNKGNKKNVEDDKSGVIFRIIGIMISVNNNKIIVNNTNKNDHSKREWNKTEKTCTLKTVFRIILLSKFFIMLSIPKHKFFLPFWHLSRQYLRPFEKHANDLYKNIESFDENNWDPINRTYWLDNCWVINKVK